jgi:hypothetical protein
MSFDVRGSLLRRSLDADFGGGIGIGDRRSALVSSVHESRLETTACSDWSRHRTPSTALVLVGKGIPAGRVRPPSPPRTAQKRDRPAAHQHARRRRVRLPTTHLSPPTRAIPARPRKPTAAPPRTTTPTWLFPPPEGLLFRHRCRRAADGRKREDARHAARKTGRRIGREGGTSCARRRRAGQSRGSRARADRPSEARLPVCSPCVRRFWKARKKRRRKVPHGDNLGRGYCYACRLRTSATLRRRCSFDAARLQQPLPLLELVSWHEPPPQHSLRTRARSQSIVHVPDSTEQHPWDGQSRGRTTFGARRRAS